MKSLSEEELSDVESPIMTVGELSPIQRRQVELAASELIRLTGEPGPFGLSDSMPVHIGVRAEGTVAMGDERKPFSSAMSTPQRFRELSRLKPNVALKALSDPGAKKQGILSAVSFLPSLNSASGRDWMNSIRVASHIVEEYLIGLDREIQDHRSILLGKLSQIHSFDFSRQSLASMDAPAWVQNSVLGVIQKNWATGIDQARQVASRTRLEGITYTPILQVRVTHNGRTFIAHIPL